MIDSRELELDAAVPAPVETVPEPTPRVIIQYRNRGVPPVLIPPLLILLATLVILSYQRQTPIRSALPGGAVALSRALAPEPKSTSVATIPTAHRDVKYEPIVGRDDSVPSSATDVPPALPVVPAPTPAAVATVSEPKPIVEPRDLFEIGSEQGLKRVEPGPAAAAAPASETPENAQTLVKPEPAERPAIGFDRPAEAAPQPAPQKDEVVEGIQREAEQKHAEQQKMEVIKAHSKEIEIAEAIRRAHEKRGAFLGALRDILKTDGKQGGAQIEDLCVLYGRSTPEEIRAEVRHEMRRLSARSTRASIIAMMREKGLPEPIIFDYLNDLHRTTMNARNGPRDLDEVRVRAARQLLAFPAPSTPTTRRPGRSLAETRPPAPRRPQQ